ncbi:MAG TPA: RIP metalloprotease RseP [Gammaproteobacteria bacterium]|nr:RIP metalloprotease RseP [Gammaproteobacteria bacterium]
MTFLTSLLAFIGAIAILVAFHEFGHYWVAKKLGIKVLRFSVGFGKPIWSKTAGKDQTEYVLAAIPLGGYVKMLDEREGNVPENEAHRAFNRQSVWTRIAVVAAGPIANFLLAIAVYLLMYMVGVNGIKPKIGEVIPDSPAAIAGITAGTTIQAVNGVLTPSWEDATLTMIKEALAKGTVELSLQDTGGLIQTRALDLANSRGLLGEGDVLRNIGIQPWRPIVPAVFSKLIASGAAAKAGLLVGDQVTEVDGQKITVWRDMVTIIQANAGQSLDLVVKRDNALLRYTVVPEQVENNGKTIGRIGALPKVDQSEYDDMRVTVQYGPIESFVRGVKRTWNMSSLTLRVLWKMVVGEASLKNISGPLTIAEYAGVSATLGLAQFLSFLGIVSVSLGVLNLLPIPVLDGGHLLYYFIEVIKGGPVSQTTEAVGQRMGLALLGCLMFVAFFNDISRLLS